jgi:type I restriction enzyme S subunit
LKYLCRRSALYGANEPTESYVDDGIRFLRTSDIDDEGRLSAEGAVYLPRETVGEYILKNGDLLISRSGTLGRMLHYQNKLHGECAYAGYLVRFEPSNRLHPQFAYYFTKSLSFQQWLSFSAIQSTIGNINGQKYANMPLPVPQIQEQHAIASFLDHETAKIDTLIAKKERLIELFQEKRTALITQAVTKGLDSNVPMKDSGVEWLGKIPAHWDVNRLKTITEFRGGGTPSKDNLDYWQGDIPWVSPKDMKVSIIVDTEEKITPQAVCESATKRVPARAVLLVVRSGILIHSIPVALSGREVTLNQDLKALIPRSEILPEYLLFLISGMQRELLAEWKKEGATVESLEIDLVAQTKVPLPDEGEQRRIVAFLDRETAKIDDLVAKIHEAIERLKEYRTALISAAVTGKIDVRYEGS